MKMFGFHEPHHPIIQVAWCFMYLDCADDFWVRAAQVGGH